MRDATNKILEMIDDGLLDARDVALMCLRYMSEDDVADMAEANEIYFDKEDEEDNYEDEEGELECPYVVFAGKSSTEEHPMSAWPTYKSATEAALKLLEKHKYAEVVFMPEDNDDINEVMWQGIR